MKWTLSYFSVAVTKHYIHTVSEGEAVYFHGREPVAVPESLHPYLQMGGKEN